MLLQQARQHDASRDPWIGVGAPGELPDSPALHPAQRRPASDRALGLHQYQTAAIDDHQIVAALPGRQCDQRTAAHGTLDTHHTTLRPIRGPEPLQDDLTQQIFGKAADRGGAGVIADEEPLARQLAVLAAPDAIPILLDELGKQREVDRHAGAVDLGKLDQSRKVPMIRSTARSTASVPTGMISLPSRSNHGLRRSL